MNNSMVSKWNNLSQILVNALLILKVAFRMSITSMFTGGSALINLFIVSTQLFSEKK